MNINDNCMSKKSILSANIRQSENTTKLSIKTPTEISIVLLWTICMIDISKVTFITSNKNFKEDV